MSCNCENVNYTKQIKIKKLSANAKIPTRGSVAAAGYDLYADITEPLIILAHETVLIGTGLAFELPDRTFGALYARSGLASKKGLRPANCVGVVDSDYRGEVKIALHNDSDEAQEITVGERIAQMILHNYIPMEFKEVDELSDTARSTNGFGSTGQF